ncbi:hypothetical protein V6N12_047027 [Hibiscus sabdariffa]|uniref:RNase H type-1 domain-containing protein n=2 Tax=Hibiscus sabdariffa TaxID=183260 RepID=A0ABR2ATD0_9ROSI
MVSDLISPTSNTWKENVIKSVFDRNQANRILCVPLPNIALPDTVIWRGERTGEFSVKYGYKMLNDCIGDDPSRHLHSEQHVFFNKLCQANIPSIIKITVWRFAKNYLLCNGGPESVDHLVQQCEVSVQVFAALHINLPTRPLDQQWLEWLSHFSLSLSLSDCIILFIAIWAIWGLRNKIMHNNNRIDLPSLLTFIKSYARDYAAAQPSISPTISSLDERIVIRNHKGMLMVAATFPSSFISDHCVAEAKACEQAVDLTYELNFRRVIFEGDSPTVLRKPCSPAKDMSLISMIIKSVKTKTESFDKVTFQHRPRNCNKVAHLIAQLGHSSFDTFIWMEEAPPPIEELIKKDRWSTAPPI